MREISQAQARRFKKRAESAEATLRQQRNRWASDWRDGWVNIETLTLSDASFAKVDVTRRLGHAIVVVPGGRANEVRFYADRL